MRKSYLLILLIIGFLYPVSSEAQSEKFVDFSPATKMLELQIHGLVGGSSVTQNYDKLYSRIQNHNVNMGNSWGVGAKAVFGVRNFFGFGTSANIMLNYYNIDMAIVGEENTSMSAVFVNNRTVTFNIPVFASFRFNVAHSVRWDIDAGFYYAYGFAGRQKQQIYRAEINAVDELVPEIEKVTTDYYHSDRTLFNVFNRGDIGIHLGMSINFGPHLAVGFQTQYGLKNSARSNIVDNPSVHNFYMAGLLGYRF